MRRKKEQLLIMPGEPLAQYPQRNALSDIFDCIKKYVGDIPDGDESTEAMRFCMNQPTHLYIRLQVYDSVQTLYQVDRVCESDHAKRKSVVGAVSEINRVAGRPGEMIHDDLKQLCDLYFRVEQLPKADWTQGIWLSVEWLLNDISRYYEPSPYPLNHQVTDEQNLFPGGH